MNWVRDAAGVVGAASVTYGCWLIFEPSGFVVGGLMLVIAALLSARVS
jgi:hypothetical protein